MPDLSSTLNTGRAGDPGDVPGRGLTWAAIAWFAAAPFLCVWTIIAAVPPPMPEHVEKAEKLQARTGVDTVVVGDSRVAGIPDRPFADRGWQFFNMGLSGTSPEDMAMQLKYAMSHARVRRVAMGVSFEGMTAAYPFEFSRFHSTGPFASREIVEFATVDEGPRREKKRAGLRQFLRSDLLPIAVASERLRSLVAKITGRVLADETADGTALYTAIESQIASGDYDFARQRDPNIYFAAAGADTRYLETPQLSPSAKRLYEKVFAALRAERIACVVFETGRTAAYQAMLDARPELARLQRQWRDFFRAESYGGIRFLDAQAMKDVYRDGDFFDAVHFLAPTTTRLATRLADELADIERSTPGAPPAALPANKDR